MENKRRLIDLDEAIAKVKDDGILGEGYSDDERIDDVCDILESCEIVDAVEAVNGEWEFGELGLFGADVRCSKCGWGCENVDPILWVTYPGHKFCGACGAKMDGERKDNEKQT